MNADLIIAHYHLTLDPNERAEAKAHDICLEQTVEVVESLVPPGFITNTILGKVLTLEPLSESCFRAEIGYDPTIVAYQIPQLLSVLFGNISLKPGIRLVDLSLPEDFVSQFTGPKFGIPGLRQRLQAYDRPLLASAVKPMGKSAEELGELCFQLASGGMDIIKDDHGLVDHSFCPFEDRIQACTTAIRMAADKTGKRTLYFASVTDSYDALPIRIHQAQEAGVDGILLSPYLVGLDTLRFFAADEDFQLPIMAHPAFSGAFFQGTTGIDQGILLGKLLRLCGADLVVYPNFGGRFSFSEAQCKSIQAHLLQNFSHLTSAFPVPAGGMALESIPKLQEFYGNEVVYLIGSALLSRSLDIPANVAYFRRLCGLGN